MFVLTINKLTAGTTNRAEIENTFIHASFPVYREANISQITGIETIPQY